MYFRKSVQLGVLSLLAIVLTACNLGATPAPTVDVNAIYTSAAETALFTYSQQLTQTALAASPTPMGTNTPAASNTPFPTAPLSLTTPIAGFGTPAATIVGLASPIPTAAGPACLNAAFISDVTVSDGSEMEGGQDFEKVWAIQNSGTCDWDEGFVFAWVSGDNLDGYDIEISNKNKYNTHDFVKAGETTQFKIDMTAPLAKREYNACWRMKDDTGEFFGTFACVKINVPD